MLLKDHSSFNMGGAAVHLVEIYSKEELRAAVREAQKLGIPFHIVGKGTNTVFHDKEVHKFVIKNCISGIEIISENNEATIIKIGAGEHWDDVVKFAVDKNLSGIEAMSAIPGSTGAAPVQNIGAYGQEIKDTLVDVEVYDVKNDVFKTLSNSECEFAYRDSIFKKLEYKNKYVIVSVLLRLSSLAAHIPNYPGVKEYFEKHHLNSENPSLIDIRNAIIEIRKSKLPDPSIVPNVGSFFKNAIISKEDFEILKAKYPTIPNFPSGDQIKIPTGWLLEQSGFKGKHFGHFKTHDANALVMTHIGTGTLDELKKTVKEIQNKVKEMFAIEIEMEANIVE